MRITFAMIGKMCISGSFAIIYLYSAELFPTCVRSIGIGTGSTCARIGGLIAPFLAELVSKNFMYYVLVIYSFIDKRYTVKCNKYILKIQPYYNNR